MKKFLYLITALFTVGVAYAQDATYYTTRIAQVYHGKPKTVMDITESMGACVMEFDQNGRIISKIQDKYDYTILYEWGERTIKASAVKPDGSVFNVMELYYVEDADHLLVGIGGNTFDHVFNSNGTWSKFIHTYNNKPSFILQFEYADDNPYVYVKSRTYNGKELVCEIDAEATEFDEQGNVTEFVETLNGQKVTTRRQIIYYDEESADAVQTQNGQDSDLRRAADLASTAYKNMLMTKDYAEARRCFEAAAQIYKAKKGPEDQKYLESVYGLADACEKLDDNDAALRYFKLYAEHTRVNPMRIYLRIGMLCNRMRNFQEAALYYGRGVALFECGNVKWNNDVSKCYHRLSEAQERLGDYQTALATVRRHIKSEMQYWGNGNSMVAATKRAALLCHRLGDDNQALKEYDRCMALLEDIELGNNKQKNLYYAVILNDRGLSHMALCRYDEALADYQQSLKIRQAVQGIETIDYAATLSNIGLVFRAKGQYDKAFQSLEQALKIFRETVGCDNTEYLCCIANLGEVHTVFGNYDQALKYCHEALDGFRKYLGEQHSDYAQSLSNLATLYALQANYEESLRCYMEAAEIFAQTVGKQHPLYFRTLGNIGTTYLRLENLSKAKKQLSKACSLWRKTGKEFHSDYALALNSLATVYIKEYNFRDALTQYEKAAEIQCRMLGPTHPDYAITMNNISATYQEFGDYRRAMDYLTRCTKIQSLTKALPPLEAAVPCLNLGSIYHALGNYAEAEKQYRRCADIQLEVIGDRHPDYARTLNNLGVLYADMQRNDEAVNCLKQCSRIYLEIYGQQSPQYAHYQSNIAAIYNYIGLWKMAEQILSEARQIYEALSMQNTVEYALTLHKLAYACSAQGRGKYSQTLNLQSAEILRKLVGTRHPDYLIVCNDIGLDALFAGEYSVAEQYMREVLEGVRGNIRTDFTYLTEQERLLYWNQKQVQMANIFALGAGRVKKPTARLIYDASLLNKGLLLSTNIALETAIRDSKDEQLIADFNELRALRYRLMRIHRESQSLPSVNVDSLERRATEMEASIQDRSKAFGNYLRHTLVNWSDVRAKLTDGEAAIEFVSYGFKTDTLYDALIVRPNRSSPQHVHLCSLKELRERINSPHDPQIYRDPQCLNKYIWEPLEPYLSNIKRVYFAPSGELYNIGVEYLPTPKGQRMCDRFQMIRLSSTREIVRPSAKSDFKSAALFGGLNYNTDIEDMVLNATDYGTRGAMCDRFNRENLQISGIWSYLRGTREEVDRIANIFPTGHCKISKYTGDEGVEETFKSLSEKGVELVHIATHGFYFPVDKPSREMIRLNRLPREDQSLQRCGLVFTGANHIWLADSAIPEEIDDGILTGREISSLDLRGNDLVVLSACQTGVGEVTGEGVFGLQRAFKKAGAGTLLMSLWEVNDEVTQLMMTEFYKSLVSGKSKHEALRQAQERIRERTFMVNGEEQSGTDPHFWAAFILMD